MLPTVNESAALSSAYALKDVRKAVVDDTVSVASETQRKSRAPKKSSTSSSQPVTRGAKRKFAAEQEKGTENLEENKTVDK